MQRTTFLFCLLILLSIGGCKKNSICDNNFRANISGVSDILICFSIGRLDSNTLTLESLRPNQTLDSKYDIDLRCNKQTGVHQLDSTNTNQYFILYENYWGDKKTYSTYRSGDHITMTITSINDDAKIISGTLSGSISEIDSLNDIVQITNASFKSKYD